MKRTLAFLLIVIICIAQMRMITLHTAKAEGESSAATQESPGSEQPDPGEEFLPLDTDDVKQETDPKESVETPWDEAFAKYVESRLYPKSDVRKNAAGNRLDGTNRTVYDRLSVCIAEVANGTRFSTVFTVSAEGLDMDTFLLSQVHAALVADLPYELYWYDKMAGCRYQASESGELLFWFSVAQEYSAGEYEVNTAFGQAVETTVLNAQSIVDRYAQTSDYEKLTAYRKEICELTSYNYDALGDDVPYGNPWQLIWVFDGDPDTSVVCEGYAKAFQYLCDLSAFHSDTVRCITVTGTMRGGTGEGEHMWNIVRMDDGFNYLVDVTNCDEGTAGYPFLLFLAGRNSVPTNIGYQYGEESITLYSEDDLSINAERYNTLNWEIVNGEELMITGTGELVFPLFDASWVEFCGSITSINVGEGITDLWHFNSIYPIFPPELYPNLKTVVLPEGLCAVRNREFEGTTIEEINIPGSVNEIGYQALDCCRNLKTVIIGEGVKKIGIQCFKDCDALESIAIPSSVETISREAFSDCSSLETVTLNEGLRQIGIGCFQCCKKLTSITIPESVNEICRSAFADCTSLEQLVLPQRMDAIGKGAFGGCTKLSGAVVLPEGVTTLEESTFYGCPHIEEIVLPSTLEKICGGAFSHTSIQTITIPSRVREIEDGAFSSCESLYSITLNEGLEKLGASFAFCRMLRSIHVPASVTEIDVSKTHLSSLAEITVDPNNPCFASIEGILYNKACTELLKCPPLWEGDPVFPAALTVLHDHAFEGCYLIESVVIPAGITHYGAYIFSSCTGLETVVLPDDMQSIPDGMFNYCVVLKTINIPASVTSIGEGAFRACWQLEDLMIPASVTQIGAEAFIWCELLNLQISGDNPCYTVQDGVLYTKDMSHLMFASFGIDSIFTVPTGVKTIDCSSFEGNLTLEQVTVADTVETIEDRAFYGCPALTAVHFGTNIETIGTFAFGECPILRDLTFDCTGFTIGTAAFSDCEVLECVSVPGEVKAICDTAFEFCSGLTTVEIPNVTDYLGYRVFEGTPYYENLDWDGDVLYRFGWAVKANSSISGSYTLRDGTVGVAAAAFENCDQLTEIVFPDSMRVVGQDAFSKCSVLNSIVLNDGLKRIYDSAFCGRRHTGYPFYLFIPDSVEYIGRAFCDAYSTDLFIIFFGDAPTFHDEALLAVHSSIHIAYPNQNATWAHVISSQLGAPAVKKWDFVTEELIDAEESVEWTPMYLDSISVSSDPLKTEYCQNTEDLDVTGGTVLINYLLHIPRGDFTISHNAPMTPDMVSGFDNTTPGTQVITVTIGDQTATFEIEITEAPKPVFRTQALTLEGRIGVNFFIELPQDAGVTYEGVEFTIDSIDGVPAFVPFKGESHPTNGSGYYLFTYYVRTIEMANTITASLRYTLNGSVGTLDKTYSVKTYFDTFDQYISLFSEKQQNMVKATADLGHYIQAFLAAQKGWTFGTDYVEMDKYYADYTSADISAAAAALAPYEVSRSTGTHVSKINYTLVLDSDTELLVYFKPAKSYTGAFTFTVNGETVTEDGEKMRVSLQSDGRYMVSIKNIAAHELANVYEIKALSDGDEASITVSALSYANAMITGYANDSAWVNAAIAIWRYATAAEAMMT